MILLANIYNQRALAVFFPRMIHEKKSLVPENYTFFLLVRKNV